MGIFTGKRNSNNDDVDDIPDDGLDLNKNWEDTQRSLRDLVTTSSSLVKTVGDELVDDTITVVNGLKNASTGLFKTIHPDEPIPAVTSPLMDALSYKMQDEINDVFPFFGYGNGFSSPHFGTLASTIPSVKKYDSCMNNDGLSVWDRYGVWKCLLPKSKIEQIPELCKKFEPLISKEDYLQNENDIQTRFFQNVNDLLAWKSGNAKIEREKLIKQREEYMKKLADNRSASSQVLQYGDGFAEEEPLKVVENSKSVSTVRNADGSVEQITKTAKTFEDGTTKHEEIRKVIGTDGTETVTKNENNLDSSSNSWFWKK